MSKKNKLPDFSQFRIFFLVGAIGAAVAAAILIFLYLNKSIPQNKKEDEPEPDEKLIIKPERITKPKTEETK
jgi:Na+/H+ antiporter NhaD/arsenite permease-like protein